MFQPSCHPYQGDARRARFCILACILPAFPSSLLLSLVTPSVALKIPAYLVQHCRGWSSAPDIRQPPSACCLLPVEEATMEETMLTSKKCEGYSQEDYPLHKHCSLTGTPLHVVQAVSGSRWSRVMITIGCDTLYTVEPLGLAARREGRE